MFYTPKHCCECGEKIGRDKWKLFASRRFCEICESDFKMQEWAARAVVAFGVLGLLFGVGNLLKKTDAPLKVSTTPILALASNKNQSDRNSPTRTSADTSNQGQTQATATNANVAAQTESTAQTETSARPAPAKQNLLDRRQNSAPAAVYFCGAQTKKGSPCTRRIKIGGRRCWQHEGQPAMLPPEKLVAAAGDAR